MHANKDKDIISILVKPGSTPYHQLKSHVAKIFPGLSGIMGCLSGMSEWDVRDGTAEAAEPDFTRPRCQALHPGCDFSSENGSVPDGRASDRVARKGRRRQAAQTATLLSLGA